MYIPLDPCDHMSEKVEQQALQVHAERLALGLLLSIGTEESSDYVTKIWIIQRVLRAG